MLIDYLHSKYHRELEDGWGALEIGNLTKAERHFSNVLQSEDDPDMALLDLIDAHNGMAAVARGHKDFFDAHRLYKESEYLIGKLYKDRMPERLSWNDPRERPLLRTLIGLAHTAYVRKNTKEAERYYRRVIKRDPRDHLGVKRYMTALENGEPFPDR